MKNRKLKMISAALCVTMASVTLAGCKLQDMQNSSSNSSTISNRKNKEIKQLQTLAQQKQNLSEKLWSLQNAKTILLNQSNFKGLAKIKQPLFDTANKLTQATNKMIILNKILRQRYHHAVLDNGQIINSWTLLKTDDSLSNHQRAHILINKMKKLQSQQQTINEKLWDDQNKITDALNHNNQAKLNQLQKKYFEDRLVALPIMNKIDMLTIQISKFTQDLDKSTFDIHYNQTLDDWIIWQTIANNNQRLNQAVTPANPNDDINQTRSTVDNDNENHSTTNTNEDENENHSTTTTNEDDNNTTHITDTGGDDGGGHVSTGGAHGAE